MLNRTPCTPPGCVHSLPWLEPVRLRTGKPYALVELWEKRKDRKLTDLLTFTVIITDPNEVVQAPP